MEFVAFTSYLKLEVINILTYGIWASICILALDSTNVRRRPVFIYVRFLFLCASGLHVDVSNLHLQFLKISYRCLLSYHLGLSSITCTQLPTPSLFIHYSILFYFYSFTYLTLSYLLICCLVYFLSSHSLPTPTHWMLVPLRQGSIVSLVFTTVSSGFRTAPET